MHISERGKRVRFWGGLRDSCIRRSMAGSVPNNRITDRIAQHIRIAMRRCATKTTEVPNQRGKEPCNGSVRSIKGILTVGWHDFLTESLQVSL